MANGHARPSQIQKTLGTAPRSLVRWRKQLHAHGAGSFYQLRAVRGAAVLNVETSAQCQLLLDEGHSIATTARLAGIKDTTLRKAIAAGRITKPATTHQAAAPAATDPSTKSQRRPKNRPPRHPPGNHPNPSNRARSPQSPPPRQPLPLAKTLTDTVKMIAYRAETALVGLLRRHLANEAEARALIRELFVSGADLEPAGTLTIRIHRMATPVHDRAITQLLDELTTTNYCHPETGHRVI